MRINMFLLLSLLFVFGNCTSENDEIPNCISDSYFENDNHLIKTQVFNGEKHFWLNTQISEADGTEYILNESCDSVCSFNGLFYPECWLAYDEDEWRQIWP